MYRLTVLPRLGQRRWTANGFFAGWFTDMSTTLRDIADEVGLSHVAVSNVLRSTGRVSDSARRRVLDAAARLGYRPHAAAANLSRGRHSNIGLLLSQTPKRSYLPHQLLIGIESELAARSLLLTVGRLPDDQLTREGFVPELLKTWCVDGLLVNYQEDIPDRMIGLIQLAGTPAVWINSKHHGACVYPDEFDAGWQAAGHLLALGHRRIAYVDFSHAADGFEGSHFSATDRQRGAEAAMADAGLSLRVIREPRVVDLAARPAIANALLRAADRPTAVIGYGNTTIIPVQMQAMLLGLRMPEDLALVCFDDAPVDRLGVSVTTLVSPLAELGSMAVKLLVELLGEMAGRRGVGSGRGSGNGGAVKSVLEQAALVACRTAKFELVPGVTTVGLAGEILVAERRRMNV